MKHLKRATTSIALLLFTVVGYSQTHSIMFYNVENLYDTQRDTTIYDEDFTPEGIYKWDDKKYWVKIDRLTEVFQKIGEATGGFPILIGLCEVENRGVLQDLTHAPRVQAARYQIVHYDSPDARGMDVAFLYRSDVIEYVSSKPIPVRDPTNPRFRTRDILWFTGTIDGEIFHFFVNHWPSRRGGERASAPRRELAASILRHVIDSLKHVDATAKFVVMGDFNDDPNNNSVERVLRAKGNIKNLREGDLFNPFHAMHRAGLGTLPWNDAWNLFDMIMVSQNMVNNSGGFQLYSPAKSKYYGFIFNKPFLMQQEGRFKGYPWRTYVGNTYRGGYSDHFPVYILISN
ncbi:MAG: endonuclease/exonuclease/phosphatase family protein [Bacteroidales bacterium]|nr:endonuclease/exonuclease/phosphatase family protein [Bacteroidales bacterium]